MLLSVRLAGRIPPRSAFGLQRFATSPRQRGVFTTSAVLRSQQQQQQQQQKSGNE
jgi:hypothetical protein